MPCNVYYNCVVITAIQLSTAPNVVPESQGNSKLIHKLTVDHDKNVLQWHDSLREKIQVFCVL